MAKAHALPRQSADAATRTCLTHLIVFRIHEIEACRKGVLEQSIDAVHDMRVACRRLQAVLALFGRCFHGRKVKPFRRSLRTLIRALGAVREYDVLIGHITESVTVTAAIEQTALGLLVSRYWIRREQAHRELSKVIRWFDESNILPAFLTDITRRFNRKPETRAPFRSVLREIIPVHFIDFLCASIPVVNHPRRVLALHAFRIRGKPLRYLCELSLPCFGEDFKKLYGEIKTIIELLGYIHDTDVTLATLKSGLAEIRHANRGTHGVGVTIQTAFLRRAISALRIRRDALFGSMSRTVGSWHTGVFKRKLTAAMPATRASRGKTIPRPGRRVHTSAP
ncbi:MAG: CHAD domain-containing protein [Chitinispirillaceae bacterium]|jgi:CHAD domain-containing protein|nr:CHAD domain-containing protein [Chitinispirillaceae bacterium]